MSALDDFRASVERLKNEPNPTADEIDKLVRRICAERWATPEDRQAAQRLVIALEGLKRRGNAPSSPAPT